MNQIYQSSSAYYFISASGQTQSLETGEDQDENEGDDGTLIEEEEEEEEEEQVEENLPYSKFLVGEDLLCSEYLAS